MKYNIAVTKKDNEKFIAKANIELSGNTTFIFFSDVHLLTEDHTFTDWTDMIIPVEHILQMDVLTDKEYSDIAK